MSWAGVTKPTGVAQVDAVAASYPLNPRDRGADEPRNERGRDDADN
mgnify:CR=1 FL=1